MTPGQDNIDKILDHNRLQLSALLDGELSPDEARFLLRRLQHDAELGGCWERWQYCGDLLRGQAGALLPPGFAERVAVAVAAEQGVSTTIIAGRPRWLRWGGGAALAASVAVVVLFVARQSPDATVPAAVEAPAQIATATTAANSSPAMPAPAVPRPAAPAPNISDQAAQLAAAVAVADLPRRVATHRSRGQSQRAAVRTPARAVAEAPVEFAVNAAATSLAAPADPFAAQHVSLPNRPWPRALLPNASASGAFTVDYGSRATSPSFYPFEPRVVPVAPADNIAESGNAPP